MFPMPVRPIDRWLPCVALCVLAAWPASASAQKRMSPQALEQARNRMVDQDVAGAGIKDPRVIQAMRDTPRHEFVLGKYADRAYLDMSLPIGERQTISPPMFVAYMTEQLEPQPTDRVLEIGTGSGYQAAVLSPLVKEVYSIEIVESLGKRAKQQGQRALWVN
jgi:protein-L-isoaspartate(D-aspartate) O-methyltransferase